MMNRYPAIERTKASWAMLLFLSVLCVPVAAQSASTPPTMVEVYWNSARTVVAPGTTNIVVLDENIVRAEIEQDAVRFYGIQRGETVAIGFRGGDPVSIRVRVVERPQLLPPPTLRSRPEMAQGTYGTSAQVSASNGATTASFLNSVAWSQLIGDKGHLDFTGQMEENSLAFGHVFNLRSASLTYRKPGLQIDALDFIVNLTSNGTQSYFSPLSFSDTTQLRGLNVGLDRGDTQYNFFAGTTVPFYFLTVGPSRDVAGFSFNRKQGRKLSLFGTTSFVNAPSQFVGDRVVRRNNIMQTAGLNYLWGQRWSLRATGGTSNHGSLARGEFTYTGHRLTAYGAAATSSPWFPLNQLQSLFAGTESLRAGLMYKSSDRLSESVSYQHTTSRRIAGLTSAGSSDYLGPGVWLRLHSNHDLNFNYAYSRNSGGISTQPSTGNRFDTTWHYQISSRLSNSAQLTFGSLQDPLQLNSEDQFSFRDSISIPIRGGGLLVSFEHDRTNPSLVQKLNSELSLLAPALQTLFLQDPVSFVNSGALPPEIRSLLQSQQPINTAVSASGQFSIGQRLVVDPNFSFARGRNGNLESWAPYFGYGLRYQVRPGFQLTSSLTNTWVLANTQRGGQRTTLFSIGFVKSFSTVPTVPLLGRRGRVIEGRVFRDKNVNGAFNVLEPGFDRVRVQLDSGESVETDSEGRYKFTGVGAGEHKVSIDLVQFRDAIRMTTRSQVPVDLVRDHSAVVNFGIVDFARVMGNVFNDLRFEGERRPDAKGLSDVRMVLDDGRQQRPVIARGTGDYEIDDVPPGDYKLTVDASTLPANYVLPADSFPIHVNPVSTTVLDIPTRALRSIAGSVLLRVPAGVSASAPSTSSLRPAKAAKTVGPSEAEPQYTFVPMPGVLITAGHGAVKTDENGNFLLRNLPAGPLSVTLVPVKALPGSLQVPSGSVQMPAEPIQVQGATIVISNPELVPYLVEKTAEQLRSTASNPALAAHLSH